MIGVHGGCYWPQDYWQQVGVVVNQRIKELAEQATSYADTLDVADQRIYQEIRDREFAELIVQECIDIISPYTIRMSRPGEEYLHPISEIKRNFGVKNE